MPETASIRVDPNISCQVQQPLGVCTDGDGAEGGGCNTRCGCHVQTSNTGSTTLVQGHLPFISLSIAVINDLKASVLCLTSHLFFHVLDKIFRPSVHHREPVVVTASW